MHNDSLGDRVASHFTLYLRGVKGAEALASLSADPMALVKLKHANQNARNDFVTNVMQMAAANEIVNGLKTLYQAVTYVADLALQSREKNALHALSYSAGNVGIIANRAIANPQVKVKGQSAEDYLRDIFNYVQT